MSSTFVLSAMFISLLVLLLSGMPLAFVLISLVVIVFIIAAYTCMAHLYKLGQLTKMDK